MMSLPSLIRSCCTHVQQQAPFFKASSCLPLLQLQLQQLHTAATAAAAAPADPTLAAAAAASAPPPAAPPAAAAPSAVLSSLLSGLSSKQLSAGDVGLYYDIDRSLVPEAFQQYHQAFYSPRPAKLQRKGGCRGLQAELNLTHSNSLMWRRSSAELAHALRSGAARRVYLRGPGGAGKSVALLQMVEWARSNGWIVLYVPSAVELTRGGFFYRRPEDDSYDTIISAQYILKSLADSHAQQLAGLQAQLPESRALLQSQAATDALALGGEGGGSASPRPAGKGGKRGGGGSKASAAAPEGSLMQLATTGLSTDDDGKLAVECVLALVRELAALPQATQPVLLAVDDYNSLYHATDYGRTHFVDPPNGAPYQFRRPLEVEQLNLARSMRLLEREDLGDARVLVADSSSNRVPASVEAPHPEGAAYHMPRFSEVETAHALFHYHERGLLGAPPSARQVAAMRALTNGSGTDLRRWCVGVSQTDIGLL